MVGILLFQSVVDVDADVFFCCYCLLVLLYRFLKLLLLSAVVTIVAIAKPFLQEIDEMIRMCDSDGDGQAILPRETMTHTIHVWYIYPHLVIFNGKIWQM